ELKQAPGPSGTARVPTMRVAAPLIAADGRRFGIVIADLDLRLFDRIRATARQGSRIYVVNDAGEVLLHPDANRECACQRVQDEYPALKELLQTDDATPRVLNDRSGERFGVAWQKLRLGGGPRLVRRHRSPSLSRPHRRSDGGSRFGLGRCARGLSRCIHIGGGYFPAADPTACAKKPRGCRGDPELG